MRPEGLVLAAHEPLRLVTGGELAQLGPGGGQVGTLLALAGAEDQRVGPQFGDPVTAEVDLLWLQAGQVDTGPTEVALHVIELLVSEDLAEAVQPEVELRPVL